ncbi:HNH endonuclease [Streptomyces sp. NPDC002403]
MHHPPVTRSRTRWPPRARARHAPSGGTDTSRAQNSENAVRKLKQWYQNSYQICATTLFLPSPRHRYSEAAHIRAREHGGPDLTENLLCLCPNCHVLFDAGAYVLTDDLAAVDTVTGRLQAELKRRQ